MVLVLCAKVLSQQGCAHTIFRHLAIVCKQLNAWPSRTSQSLAFRVAKPGFHCGVPYHRARDIFVPWSLVTWKVRCQNAITQQMQCCSSLWACRRSIIGEDAKLLCEARFLKQSFAQLTRSKATGSSIIRNSLYRTVGPYFLGPRNFAALLTQEGCRRNWQPSSPPDTFLRQPFE